MSTQSGDLPSVSAPRILIVEDDREVSQAVADMVRHLGYLPCVCGHVDEVLFYLKSNPVDLMLVDYRMPDMTGLDLIMLLEQDGWHIPVIMMTGYPQTISRIPVEKRKEFIVLTKPITLEPLAKAIEASLKPVEEAG